jgi:hypothetical protein
MLPSNGSVQFLSVAPGLRYAVYDAVPPVGQSSEETGSGDEAAKNQRGQRSEAATLAGGETIRVDLRTGEACRLATCVRPVVSPEDRWLVCRSPDGGVGRISLGGGSLETYRRADELVPPTDRDGGSAPRPTVDAGNADPVVPPPVSFPSIDVLMVPTREGAARTFSW